jgi:hypothetical protein
LSGFRSFTPASSCLLATEDALRDRFFPKGAIASFALMVVLYLVIWFAVYLTMISRG